MHDFAIVLHVALQYLSTYVLRVHVMSTVPAKSFVARVDKSGNW